MTLEIRLRRFSFLPDLIQNGDDPARRAHIIGKKGATPVGNQETGGRQENSPPEQSTDKFRPLASISLDEVDDVLRHLLPQMVSSPVEGWVARNYFCELPVKVKTRKQSPVVFGRVKTSFPVDGNVQNIDQMILDFPRPEPGTDLLHLHRTDINWQRPVRSYCVGIKMYLSPAERDDFRQSENIFIEKGFAPLYETGYLDLLELNQYNHATQSPFWLNVIGSEWFAGIPDSVQPEIRERLRDLAGWDRVLLNYHPKRYALRYLSLNEELDFNYDFTEHFLVSPQDTNQALHKVDEIFGRIFVQGMGAMK